MALSSAVLAGTELAAHNADLPLLAALHLLRDGLQDTETPANPWSVGGDTSDASTPATAGTERFAWDGFTHKFCAPNANQTTWYYSAQIPTADVQDFDCMFLVWKTSAADDATELSLEIADSTDFATNLQSILVLSGGAYGPGTGDPGKGAGVVNRLMHCELDHSGGVPRRYSGVEYVRLKFAATSSTPQISEFWLGNRRQLLSHPNSPFDSHHEFSDRPSLQSTCGLTAQRAHSKGKGRRDMSITMRDDADKVPIDGWWRDSHEGTRSFLWVESPNVAPVGYVMSCAGPQSYDPIMHGPNRRELVLPQFVEFGSHASGS